MGVLALQEGRFSLTTALAEHPLVHSLEALLTSKDSVHILKTIQTQGHLPVSFWLY